MNSSSTFRLISVVLVAFFWLPASAIAQQFTFTLIVDSFRPQPSLPGATFNIPGGTHGAPANSGRRISFVVNPIETGLLQLWTSDTQGHRLRKLVDSNTAIPAGVGTFVDGYDQRMRGANVVFLGVDEATAEEGFYSVPVLGGAITPLVNQDTSKPDGTGLFGATAFSAAPFDVSAGNTVFTVHGAVFSVPVAGGSLSEPADPTKFFICESGYGFGGLSGYNSGDVSGGSLAMVPFNVFGEAAVYAAPLTGFTGVPAGCAGSELQVDNAVRVASINTPVPADPNGRNFDAHAFQNAQIAANLIVFDGAATPLTPGGAYDLAGLYGYSLASGTTVKLVDNNTPVPGGNGVFQQFSDGVISGGWTVSAGHVVFLGIDAAGIEGLYLVRADGAIVKIVAVGDTLPDGRTVIGNGGAFYQPPIQPDSMHRKSLAMRLDFIDPVMGQGNGIYLVSW